MPKYDDDYDFDQDQKQLQKKIKELKKTTQVAQTALKKQQQQKKKAAAKAQQDKQKAAKAAKTKAQQQKTKAAAVQKQKQAKAHQKQKQKSQQKQPKQSQKQKAAEAEVLTEEAQIDKDAKKEAEAEAEAVDVQEVDQNQEAKAAQKVVQQVQVQTQTEEDKAVKSPDVFVAEQLASLGPTFVRSDAVENKLAAMTTLDRLGYIDSVVEVYLKEKETYTKSYQTAAATNQSTNQSSQSSTPVSKKTFFDFLKDVVTNLLNAKCTADEWRTSLAKKKSGIQQQEQAPDFTKSHPSLQSQSQLEPASLYPIGMPSQTAAPALQSLFQPSFQSQQQFGGSPFSFQSPQHSPTSLVQEIVQKEKEKYVNQDVLEKMHSELAKKKYKKWLTNDERKHFNNFYQTIMLTTGKPYITTADIIQFKKKYADACAKLYDQKQKKLGSKK